MLYAFFWVITQKKTYKIKYALLSSLYPYVMSGSSYEQQQKMTAVELCVVLSV